MIRQMIVPTENTYLLHLPDNLIGKNVEMIAFSQDDVSNEEISDQKIDKRSVQEAIAFYIKNAVDFSKSGKRNREDLYE